MLTRMSPLAGPAEATGTEDEVEELTGAVVTNERDEKRSGMRVREAIMTCK